jgi:hypothetical protein
MRKDRFTDEALAQAKALAELKMNDAESFAEAYDYARCQRPDGSFYGIPSGKQCRKGSKAAPTNSGSKKSAAQRMAAAYDKGGFAPKKDKKSDAAVKPAGKKKKLKTDFRKDVEKAAEIRRARDKAIEKLQRRQAAMRKRYAKANRLAAIAVRTKDKTKSERAQKLVDKIGDKLDTLNEQMEKYTKSEGKRLK